MKRRDRSDAWNGCFWISPSLTVVLPVLYASRAIVLLWYLLIVVRRVTAGWHLVFDRGEARSLISFGGWMTLSGLVTPLIVALDRFLIGVMIGAIVLLIYKSMT